MLVNMYLMSFCGYERQILQLDAPQSWVTHNCYAIKLKLDQLQNGQVADAVMLQKVTALTCAYVLKTFSIRVDFLTLKNVSSPV
jgi:hypothetical protein